MKIRKHVAAMLVICLVLTAVIIGCAAPAPAPTPTPTPAPKELPQPGGILKIAVTLTMSPFGYTPTIPGVMAMPADPCYESLLWLNSRKGEFEPMLAESWQDDPGGKFFTLKLRKGVKFHDGTAFNAQSLKDYLTLKMTDMRGWMANIRSMDVIDEHTLRLNTTHIDINFYANLTEQISSPTHLAKGRDAVAFHPVGTGPFKFAEFKRDAYLRYTRFDDWWGGKPYLDGVEFIFTPDRETQLATLLAGESLAVTNIAFKDVARMKAAGYVLPEMTAVYNGFAPDSANPDSPLANKKVREAIEHAINRAEIAKSLGYGYIHPHDLLIPSDCKGYIPGQGRKYDPDRAKQLLTEAGFPAGFEMTITVNALALMDTIVAMQSDLAKVGIRARIDTADMGRFVSMRNTGWKNGLIYVHGMYAQPLEYYVYRTWAKERRDYVSAKRPPGFDDILDKSIMERDAKAREAAMQALAKSVQEEVMYIPFITRTQVDAVSPKVRDWGVYKEHLTRYCWHKYNPWLSK